MKVLVANLLLAILWRLATGQPGIASLAVGFAIGYFVLWWLKPLFGETDYFRKLPQGLRFAAFFLAELLLANLRVAYDVVTPRANRRPGIIAVPLDARTDVEITLFANLLTLTPGTLSLDVSADRSVLYVHSMFLDDPEEARQKIKDGFERRVIELLRTG